MGILVPAATALAAAVLARVSCEECDIELCSRCKGLSQILATPIQPALNTGAQYSATLTPF